MRIYVIDAPALISLEEVARSMGVAFEELLAKMTDLAEAHRLVCPQLVLKECRAYGQTDIITTWIRAASGHLQDISPPYQLVDQVINGCPTLFNPDDTTENAQVEVLALALARVQQNHNVRVVTGQWLDLPDRSALANVAHQVHLRVWTVERFVDEMMSA